MSIESPETWAKTYRHNLVAGLVLTFSLIVSFFCSITIIEIVFIISFILFFISALIYSKVCDRFIDKMTPLLFLLAVECLLHIEAKYFNYYFSDFHPAIHTALISSMLILPVALIWNLAIISIYRGRRTHGDSC